jgi:Protein of unknown function (DUF2911)
MLFWHPKYSSTYSMKKLFFILTLAFVAAFSPAIAQIQTPQPSPSCKVTQTVGLGKIDIEYSRPSAKGRKVFGDLVPFGEMWRTGANASTKVMLTEDAKVGGVMVGKGTYALYTMPGEKEWTVIFYKNTAINGVPGKDFKETDVAARFMAPVMKLNDKVETFTIAISNLRNNGADIEVMWENTKIVIPVAYDTDTKVMASIQEQMSGPSAGAYQAAANYYYTEKKDLKQALEWVNKCLEKGGEKFWILRLKANILGDLGMYKDAIMVAEKSTELAKKEGNMDYPRMNEKSIAEWTKKK